MKHFCFGVVWVLSCMLVCSGVGAAPVGIPPLKGRVTDLTATLTPAQCQQLEGTLQQFEAAKGSQVVVLMVPSTGEETIEQFGIRVADQWKIGRQGVDDGVILLVAKGDRTLRIEVGRGLEGALPDATASRIINEIIVPFFKAGNFFGGIQAGVGRIILTIQGEPLPAPVSTPRTNDDATGGIWVSLITASVVVSMAISALVGRIGAGLIGGGAVGVIIFMILGSWLAGVVSGVIAFLLIFLLASASRESGGYSGYSSGGGGWSSGSSGGGGFSGGGGSFGGGGASGRW